MTTFDAETLNLVHQEVALELEGAWIQFELQFAELESNEIQGVISFGIEALNMEQLIKKSLLEDKSLL